MHKVALTALLAAFAFGASMTSAEVICPIQTSEPPAITATGPYHIIDFGTTEASVAGLPDCATATDYAMLLVEAVDNGATPLVTLADDSTYVVTLVQD